MNPKSMVIIDLDSNGYFQMVKDKDQVFYGFTEILDVDVNTFHSVRTDSSLIYEDKNWLYEENYFLNKDEKYRKQK